VTRTFTIEELAKQFADETRYAYEQCGAHFNVTYEIHPTGFHIITEYEDYRCYRNFESEVAINFIAKYGLSKLHELAIDTLRIIAKRVIQNKEYRDGIK
jgi:hypothetical protein